MCRVPYLKLARIETRKKAEDLKELNDNQDDNNSDNDNDGVQEDVEKLFVTRGAMQMYTADATATTTNKSINTIRKLKVVSCSSQQVKEGDTNKNDTNNGMNMNNNNNNNNNNKKEALKYLAKSKAKIIEYQKK